MKAQLIAALLFVAVQFQTTSSLSIGDAYRNVGRNINAAQSAQIAHANDDIEQDMELDRDHDMEHDNDGDLEYADEEPEPPSSTQATTTTTQATTMKIFPSKTKHNKRPAKPKKPIPQSALSSSINREAPIKSPVAAKNRVKEPEIEVEKPVEPVPDFSNGPTSAEDSEVQGEAGSNANEGPLGTSEPKPDINSLFNRNQENGSPVGSPSENEGAKPSEDFSKRTGSPFGPNSPLASQLPWSLANFKFNDEYGGSSLANRLFASEAAKKQFGGGSNNFSPLNRNMVDEFSNMNSLYAVPPYGNGPLSQASNNQFPFGYNFNSRMNYPMGNSYSLGFAEAMSMNNPYSQFPSSGASYSGYPAFDGGYSGSPYGSNPYNIFGANLNYPGFSGQSYSDRSSSSGPTPSLKLGSNSNNGALSDLGLDPYKSSEESELFKGIKDASSRESLGPDFGSDLSSLPWSGSNPFSAYKRMGVSSSGGMSNPYMEMMRNAAAMSAMMNPYSQMYGGNPYGGFGGYGMGSWSSPYSGFGSYNYNNELPFWYPRRGMGNGYRYY